MPRVVWDCRCLACWSILDAGKATRSIPAATSNIDRAQPQLAIYISLTLSLEPKNHAIPSLSGHGRAEILSSQYAMSSQPSPSNRATKRRLPRVEDFTVGWICALPIELDAARQAMDEEFDRLRDIPNYFLGRIGGHYIAIGCLSRYGTNAAASTVTDMVSTFPQLKYGLLVGIAGGVPKYLNQGVHTDIHLGDVVVGYPQGCFPGVVQYDFGKTAPDGKQSLNGSLNSPPESLIKAVSMMRSTFNLGKRKLRAKIFLDGVGTVVPYPRQPDVLYDASYHHVDGDSCGNCNREKIVRCSSRESDEIIVHYGLVASGNQVMRDGLTRDRLSQDHNGILCFEMEAAGIVNSLPCLVVRGICDYADSHKNKQWQSFAAAAAASCAKMFSPISNQQVPRKVPSLWLRLPFLRVPLLGTPSIRPQDLIHTFTSLLLMVRKNAILNHSHLSRWTLADLL